MPCSPAFDQLRWQVPKRSSICPSGYFGVLGAATLVPYHFQIFFCFVDLSASEKELGETTFDRRGPPVERLVPFRTTALAVSFHFFISASLPAPL